MFAAHCFFDPCVRRRCCSKTGKCPAMSCHGNELGEVEIECPNSVRCGRAGLNGATCNVAAYNSSCNVNAGDKCLGRVDCTNVTPAAAKAACVANWDGLGEWMGPGSYAVLFTPVSFFHFPCFLWKTQPRKSCR